MQTRKWRLRVSSKATTFRPGDIDVVVTDGFTGNIALKTAEGMARLAGGWIREALTGSMRSKLAAAIMMPALKALRPSDESISREWRTVLGTEWFGNQKPRRARMPTGSQPH